MKPTISKMLSIALFTLILTGCVKDFLDVKRDRSQIIPRTLLDFQSILDHSSMNNFSTHSLGEFGSDDYFLMTEQWQSLSSPIQKNAYVWADEIYEGQGGDDWNRAYEKILYANFAIEGVNKIAETDANKALRDEILGTAYFHRGTNYYLLAQLFCEQYDIGTAHFALGLPLRTSSNINTRYKRNDLEATYSLIIKDLELSARLLPTKYTINTRPWKPAAFAMLANAQLQMGDYQAALISAESALSLVSAITDYNEIETDVNTPFPRYGQGNKEIIFYSQMANATILGQSRLLVDTLLLRSFNDHDLRKKVFFRKNGDHYTFKGHYTGTPSFMFSGLTTPELLLIRAECNARMGNSTAAADDLNNLLSKRFAPEHYNAIDGDIASQELLKLVLLERRKELIFRGRRWHDLKRYSRDSNLAVKPKRTLDQEFTLPTGSYKWVWPIPPDVLSLGGYEQNPR